MRRDPDPSATDAARHVGRAHERLEDAALLMGRGQYADDIGVKPGTLHAAIVRSPHAHAEVRRIDVSRALAGRGVRAVLSGEDVRRWSQPFVAGIKAPVHYWALAQERVRYAGEPVAVVIAENRYLAEDGADLLQVDYAPLPPVVSIDAALAPEAPLLHPEVGSNVVNERTFRYGDPEAAFARAAHVVKLSTRYPRNSCTPIECGVAIAEWLPAEGAYEVTSNFMGPFSLHAVMALALQVPGNKLRHRVPRDSGGSFGVKQAVFPVAVLMCLASRKAGAPVKWVEDRIEHLTAATSATARATEIEAAVGADGRILALRYDQVDEVGAYLRAPEPATFYRMHGALSGAYDIPNLAVRNRVAVLNKTPTGLVRGFGGPQVYFALERLIDRIAATLGIEPIELRRRNYVRREQFPYRAVAGALLDSGDYHQVTDDAIAAAPLDELRARQAAARAEGRLYGIGSAAIVEPSISNMGYITTALTPAQRAKAGPKNGAVAAATVSIDLLGGVTVTIASAPAGQGHITTAAQVVADAFGLRPEQIVVNVEFDTQKDAWSVAAGNYSSRFAGAVAGSIHLAAMRLREKIARIAAHQFGRDARDVQFARGQVFVGAEPDRAQPFARVAGLAHWSPALLPDDMAPALRETAFFSPEPLAAPDEADHVNTSAAYGFVFDLAAVEVDPDTGRVRIDRYVTAHDAGTILNPALVDGQIRGGFAQGVGAALYEEFHYGADGSFQSGTLADYAVPTSMEIPDPLIVHRETASPFTPLGAKGVGEGNNMSTPPAIANAVADALRPLRGELDLVLPLTPARVLAHLAQEEPAPPASIARPVATAPTARGGVALRASGHVDMTAAPERVFAVLLDPAALAKVIPGCHALQSTGQHRYRADVTVGIGLVKARYAATISLSEIDAPSSLRLAGEGSSTLGTGSGDGRLRLERTATGTRLHYDYEAQVGGKVAAVGSRLLEGAARVLLNELFVSLGRQASGERRLTLWQRLLRWLGRRG
ncbi:MAG: molybdopterin-dependent oxidoreductase [Burkholderiales bacterium]|nr:molybdopterin-dependent oxidoreductase [Burkholderiales bacterium]